MHLSAHKRFVVGDKGVQHQSDVAVAGVPGLLPRGAIELESLADLGDALSQQVSEHVGPHLPSQTKGLGAPGAGNPERQLGLYGTRERPHFDRALGPWNRHSLSPP